MAKKKFFARSSMMVILEVKIGIIMIVTPRDNKGFQLHPGPCISFVSVFLYSPVELSLLRQMDSTGLLARFFRPFYMYSLANMIWKTIRRDILIIQLNFHNDRQHDTISSHLWHQLPQRLQLQFNIVHRKHNFVGLFKGV